MSSECNTQTHTVSGPNNEGQPLVSNLKSHLTLQPAIQPSVDQAHRNYICAFLLCIAACVSSQADQALYSLNCVARPLLLGGKGSGIMPMRSLCRTPKAGRSIIAFHTLVTGQKINLLMALNHSDLPCNGEYNIQYIGTYIHTIERDNIHTNTNVILLN